MILVIEHQPDCGPGLLAQWWAGREVRVVRPYLGEEPPAIGAAPPGTGLVVLGGSADAGADRACPWLPGVRAMLAEAVAAGVPTLGICLGAQLLAAATGGAVEVAARGGIEAGVIDVHWHAAAADDPLVAGLPAPMPAASMHGDAVAALPPGAVGLGWSARYPHQVFRVGPAAWGVQFHPEAAPEQLGAWADEVGRSHAEVRPERVRAEFGRRRDEVFAAGAALAHRFAALL